MSMPYRELQRDARNPFEYALIFFSLIFSTIQLATDSYPGAIYEFTDDFYRYMWGGAYFTAAAASTVGIFMKRHSLGVGLECWGMYIMGGSLAIYGASVAFTGKATGAYAAGFFFTFAAACVARALIIHIGLRRIAKGKYIRLREAREK